MQIKQLKHDCAHEQECEPLENRPGPAFPLFMMKALEDSTISTILLTFAIVSIILPQQYKPCKVVMTFAHKVKERRAAILDAKLNVK